MIRIPTVIRYVKEAMGAVSKKIQEGASVEEAGAQFAIVLYHLVLLSLNLSFLVCPCCGMTNLWRWGSYVRYVVYTITVSGTPVLITVQLEIMRLFCKNCKHAHAILPDFLIPYQTHLTGSQLKMLRDLLALKKQVLPFGKKIVRIARQRKAILKRYGYTESEAKTALKIFYRDKQEWLGATGAAEMDDCEFLDRLLSGVLRDPINLRPGLNFDMACASNLEAWGLLIAKFYCAARRSFGTGFADPVRRRHGKIDRDHPEAFRPYLLC